MWKISGFFVDNVPVRVYENKKRFGARYPEQPLFTGGIIWNGEPWANGTKIDWSKAPFQAHFKKIWYLKWLHERRQLQFTQVSMEQPELLAAKSSAKADLRGCEEEVLDS